MIDEHDDLDTPEDFEKEHAEKPSLKEIWDNNPPLKIIAIVLALVVALGAYVVFSSEEGAPSKIHVTPTARQTPAEKDVDPEYRKRMEDANRKDAEEKANKGLSHVDIPIAIANNGGLKVPPMPEAPRSDVLEEWKRVADAGRMKAAKEAVDEENQAPAPEVVPLVQPIRPQEVKPDPNLAKHFAEEMRALTNAQTPKPSDLKVITAEESPYKVMKTEKAAQAKLAATGGVGTDNGANGTGTTGSTTDKKVLVAAGSIAYAQLITTLNSDLPGPVLAEMLSGPFTGGRLIGKLTANQDCQCMALEFKTVVKDTVSYKIDAVALDENTTLPGVEATDVNHHYFSRYVLPAAASFLTGYSSALSSTGQNQTAVQGVGVATSTPPPSPKQSLFAGITSAATAIGTDLSKDASKAPTIIIAQGTTMGVFFTNTVTTGDAGK